MYTQDFDKAASYRRTLRYGLALRYGLRPPQGSAYSGCCAIECCVVTLKHPLQKGQREVVQRRQFRRGPIGQQVVRQAVEEMRLVRHAQPREVGGQLLGLL